MTFLTGRLVTYCHLQQQPVAGNTSFCQTKWQPAEIHRGLQ